MLPPHRKQRGAVAVMAALCLVVLLAVAGLVVDGGLAYLVKARLNAAADAAALAAARATSTGATPAEQAANARRAAADFFAANMPDGYLLSAPQLQSVEVDLTDGKTTVDVHADAPMRVSLMRVLGFTSLAPAAHAQSVRRDLDLALVVDTSGSLQGAVAPAVRAATATFLNRLNPTQDRVALINFAYGSAVDMPISTSARGFDLAAMLNTVGAYKFDGYTAAAEGMWSARDQLNRVPADKRSSQRVIVFFSDGAPTSFGTYLEFNNPADCTSPGVIDGSGRGLYTGLKAGNMVSAACTLSSPYANKVKTLPEWYNYHNVGGWAKRDDPAQREFRIVTDTPRKVTSDMSNDTTARRNINRAARNLAEAIADKARDEGIYVFTLGLGAELKATNNSDNESGESILKCMANVPDAPARCYKPAKPVGMYCYAGSTAELTPCYARLASALLRLSK